MADPTDDTTPLDTDFVKGAAAELRAIKAYIKNDGTFPPPVGLAALAGLATQVFAAAPPVAANQVITSSSITNVTTANDRTISIPYWDGAAMKNIIFKMGYRTNVNSGDVINFDTAFPNNNFGVLITNTGAAIRSHGTNGHTAAGFTYSTDASPDDFFFVALGD